MTLSELGSLGEIVGSLAVLITLVILVIQVRGARTEMSAQMTREIKRDNNEAYHQLIQNPDLVQLHIRGQSVWPRLRGFFDETFAEAVDQRVREGNESFLQVLLD